MIEIIIIAVCGYVLYHFSYKFGYKRGKDSANLDSYREGYRNGIDSIEKEVYNLTKEGDGEIVRRVKKFAENYKSKTD